MQCMYSPKHAFCSAHLVHVVNVEVLPIVTEQVEQDVHLQYSQRRAVQDGTESTGASVTLLTSSPVPACRYNRWCNAPRRRQAAQTEAANLAGQEQATGAADVPLLPALLEQCTATTMPPAALRQAAYQLVAQLDAQHMVHRPGKVGVPHLPIGVVLELQRHCRGRHGCGMRMGFIRGVLGEIRRDWEV